MTMDIEKHSHQVNNSITEYHINNTHVSVMNSIRRTILSDIEIYGFKGFPHEENNIKILTNNTRLNNEIIKHRVSCIPIHIKNTTLPMKDYIVYLNVKNDSDENIYVTSKDFKIKHTETNKELSEEETRKIFPPCPITGDYILIARLRGKLSDEIPSEHLHLECSMSLVTAKQDSVYNVASTCSYSFQVDSTKQEEEWKQEEVKLQGQEMDEKEIEQHKENWYLGEGRRIIKKDAFIFVLESIGIYTNDELMRKACDLLIQSLNTIKEGFQKNDIKITPSNTIYKAYDILLKNIDYTIGKPIEYALFDLYYYKNDIMKYITFNRMHPHDDHSILRVGFADSSISIEHVPSYIQKACDHLITIYNEMKETI